MAESGRYPCVGTDRALVPLLLLAEFTEGESVRTPPLHTSCIYHDFICVLQYFVSGPVFALDLPEVPRINVNCPESRLRHKYGDILALRMVQQTTIRNQHNYRATPTRSLHEVVFEELKQFFYHALGLGNCLREAAAHLRGMLQSGRTLWSIAAQYLL